MKISLGPRLVSEIYDAMAGAYFDAINNRCDTPELAVTILSLYKKLETGKRFFELEENEIKELLTQMDDLAERIEEWDPSFARGIRVKIEKIK